MASRLQCKACGRWNSYGDKQPMRKFCDDECERVFDWLHRKKDDAEEPELGELSGRAKKALTRCKGLLALALGAGTTTEERASAAEQVCKILERYSFLERVEYANEQFTPEDFVRWAEKVGRERARGRSW